MCFHLTPRPKGIGIYTADSIAEDMSEETLLDQSLFVLLWARRSYFIHSAFHKVNFPAMVLQTVRQFIVFFS